jgi:hypothetical protein
VNQHRFFLMVMQDYSPTLLSKQAAYTVLLGATTSTVLVTLTVLVLTTPTVLAGAITVSGSPVTIVVVVLLTVTETRQLTCWGNLRNMFALIPFLSTWKPPVLLVAVWRRTISSAVSASRPWMS